MVPCTLFCSTMKCSCDEMHTFTVQHHANGVKFALEENQPSVTNKPNRGRFEMEKNAIQIKIENKNKNENKNFLLNGSKARFRRKRVKE